MVALDKKKTVLLIMPAFTDKLDWLAKGAQDIFRVSVNDGLLVNVCALELDVELSVHEIINLNSKLQEEYGPIILAANDNFLSSEHIKKTNWASHMDVVYYCDAARKRYGWRHGWKKVV